MLFNQSLKWWMVESINKAKLSLEHLWVIEQWKSGNKIENKWTKKLRDLHWIKDNELTSLATDTYDAIYEMEEPKEKKKKSEKPIGIPEQYEEDWKSFWNYWPKNDAFTWKDQSFPVTRSMKATEAECSKKWLKVVLSGVEPSTLLHAAKAMFSNKMEDSYRRGENQVTYLSGMIPWLSQGKYEAWEKSKLIEEKKASTDDYYNCG